MSIFRRSWAMPSADTFTVPAIRDFVREYLRSARVSVDPFARNNGWATFNNDLNPETSAEHHMDARAFLEMLITRGVKADLVIFDPPYSPRQISECYQGVGIECGMRETQSAVLYSECRTLIERISDVGTVVLSFGWNTTGMGVRWDRLETLIVCHGGAHNDTLCVADRLIAKQSELFA